MFAGLISLIVSVVPGGDFNLLQIHAAKRPGNLLAILVVLVLAGKACWPLIVLSKQYAKIRPQLYGK